MLSTISFMTLGFILASLTGDVYGRVISRAEENPAQDSAGSIPYLVPNTKTFLVLQAKPNAAELSSLALDNLALSESYKIVDAATAAGGPDEPITGDINLSIPYQIQMNVSRSDPEDSHARLTFRDAFNVIRGAQDKIAQLGNKEMDISVFRMENTQSPSIAIGTASFSALKGTAEAQSAGAISQHAGTSPDEQRVSQSSSSGQDASSKQE